MFEVATENHFEKNNFTAIKSLLVHFHRKNKTFWLWKRFERYLLGIWQE